MAATTISTNISTEGNLTVSGSGSIGTGLANHLDITGATTGNPLTITAAGTDANIPLQLAGKGDVSVLLGPTDGLDDFIAYWGPSKLVMQSNDFDQFVLRAAGSGATIAGFNSGGTLAAPTATQSGDSLFMITGEGYGATGYKEGPTIVFDATENWDDTHTGSSIRIYGFVTGSTNEVDSLIWDGTKTLIGGVAPTAIPALTSNGFVKTSGGNGTLSVQAAGISATISVRKGDDSGACNIVVSSGIITSTTC
jgi:hypothetical protein